VAIDTSAVGDDLMSAAMRAILLHQDDGTKARRDHAHAAGIPDIFAFLPAFGFEGRLILP
jgi:hypothetical protein